MRPLESPGTCPLAGNPAGLQAFVLGPRDERFAVDGDAPTHAIGLGPVTFDASSEGEAGGMLVCINRGEAKLLGHSGRWTLPAGHMVYIPPQRSYRLAAVVPTQLSLVKFTAAEADWHHEGCWAVAMSPLASEMISFAHRWGRDRDRTDPLAEDFFRTVGRLFAEWFSNERKLWTPFGNVPDMQRAIAYARDHLDKASVTETAAAAGMSERTLRRRFKEELGISWRDFVTEMRMSKAMELLRDRHSSVTETALTVGFSSIGAFTVAFTNYTGMTPSLFSRRRCDGLPGSPAAGVSPLPGGSGRSSPAWQ
ncbi:helix-turn-helix domain-containing protein [Labrys monachus]|uniref:AraC-like DNA-binding protein n=1 Tax=Labrys monachus TaxID=217067 RepID=A0ABU0FK32_9HYPH|nr:helix-turn-helix transcriptional regulator [Labrys monachus]MDQ0394410.1 AraC-like DNA-binding protein [Labrys monachus]